MNSSTRRDRERLVHEAEIIESAMTVFGEKGFDGASMDEIAERAQFTKRTVYQYFESKDELFYAVALKGFEMLFAYLQRASSDAPSGYDRLVRGSIGYYKFYMEFPNIFRLIGEIGAVKKRSVRATPRLNDLIQFDNQLFQWVTDGVSAGISDGSIRKDLDPANTTFSIIFMMTGFFNQLSATGTTFMEHFSIDPETFCRDSMNLLFGSLRATR